MLLVTDPYHALRARLIADDVGLDGLRLADAELGHPRRQLVAPPPARGRWRRSRPDHRLRPPLTTPANLGVAGSTAANRSFLADLMPGRWQRLATAERRWMTVRWSTAPVGSGVTGNTADSGSVVRGSIPLSPAHRLASLVAWQAARRPGAKQHGPFV